MDAFFIILLSLFILTTFGTLYFSFMKRRTSGVTHQFHQARMNTNMGILFISFAAILLFTPDYALWRMILIFLIFALGIINLFYGVKSWRNLTKIIKESKGAN
jgi:UDP-N-acetylmuramyl pentapeptide phosphotransferase/UDP-N-acetylglucosamine-1-phosphate transferase